LKNRDRITGGDVTLGTDFGFVIASRTSDYRFAELQQLLFVYDPHPHSTQAHRGSQS
jgi:hypothetical protein